MAPVQILSWLFAGYLSGSLAWGYWISKYIYGIDIRKKGSGNIGATNVFRVIGPIPGIITFTLDVAKGVIPVAFARRFTDASLILLLCIGIATIIGSKFSIFLKGKGGKAVNCSFGVLLALVPREAIAVFLIWCIIFISSGYVSLSSITAAISLPFLLWIFQKNILLFSIGIIISIIIVFAHRENIKRLLEGKEHRFNIWKK